MLLGNFVENAWPQTVKILTVWLNSENTCKFRHENAKITFELTAWHGKTVLQLTIHPKSHRLVC